MPLWPSLKTESCGPGTGKALFCLSPVVGLPRSVTVFSQGDSVSALRQFDASGAESRASLRGIGRLRSAQGSLGVVVGEADADRSDLNQPLVVRSSRRAWERRCVRAVIVVDAVASLVAGLTAYGVRIGYPSAEALVWDNYMALS